MKLGFVSDSLGAMPFATMLDHAARMGVQGVEVNTGGWSTAPHLNLAEMLKSADARRAFQTSFADRGLEIISLNANGNPLHPTDPAQGACLRDTIRLAGEMGIKTVCTMSGLPAGREGDLMPNWVVSSWPPETQAILKSQWEQKLLPFWTEIVALARASGVERIALEMNVSQVEVISAYRCPAYNAHCAGAKSGSWHQANIAADVKFPVRASTVTATARELRGLGLFKGGVGGYWDFTHIDARGQNIDW